jgi:glucokinase
MAVPHLPGADVFPVGPRTPEAAGPIGIIGPGTGLGVSALIPDGRKWVMVAGEALMLCAASRRRAWHHPDEER